MNAFVKTLVSNRMTLIMSLPANDPALCSAAFDCGADVVKVHANLLHRASGRSFGSIAENEVVYREMLRLAKGPMGLVPGANAHDIQRDMEAACALDFSFFSLYAHHTPAVFARRGQALMAACDTTYTLSEIEGFALVGADVLEASIIPGDEYGQPLTFRDMLHYRLICRSTPLPVVVPTQRMIRPQDVPALADVGVKAVMIGAVVTGTDLENISRTVTNFRNAIEKL
jgi:hypothetical protein